MKNVWEKIKNLWSTYKGACIGAIVALLFIWTGLFMALVYLLVIAAGMFVGNYVQLNKDVIKEKYKAFLEMLLKKVD